MGLDYNVTYSCISEEDRPTVYSIDSGAQENKVECFCSDTVVFVNVLFSDVL